MENLAYELANGTDGPKEKAIISIAVSLKRIADRLDELPPSQDAAADFVAGIAKKLEAMKL